jgi:hypothetical protein
MIIPNNPIIPNSCMVNQMSKLPTIVKNILKEAYLDFNSVDVEDDIATINLKNLLSQINDGKDKINIIEASVLFESFYKGYSEFKKSKSLDGGKLIIDPISYYDELHKKYYGDIDFQCLDRNDPITLQLITDAIHCENYILIHYIKSHFNIINVGGDLLSELNEK